MRAVGGFRVVDWGPFALRGEGRRLAAARARARKALDDAAAVGRPGSDTPAAEPAEPARFPADLSDREAAVLGLVGEGLTTDEVAERLGLSPRAVHGHLRSIYRKIHVGARGAAAEWAIAHGLTSPPTADTAESE